MDRRGYYQKYNVTRVDGKEVGRTFTIEIDKDPYASDLLFAYALLCGPDRPALAIDLLNIAQGLEEENLNSEFAAALAELEELRNEKA